jgi:hypothetical protein
VNVVERTDELVATIQAAVTASDLTDKEFVTVTDDGADAEKARSLRAGAVVVYQFPNETRPSPKVSRLTWTIGVMADGDKPREAALRVQDLLGILRAAGIFRWEDTATRTDFELTDRSTIPGYTITHIEEHRS